MTIRVSSSVLIILSVLCPTGLLAQWRNQPSPQIPPQRNGKPNLSALAPRLPDGKPDLSGIWMPLEGSKYAKDLAADLKPGDVPFQPWARKLFDTRVDGSHSREDPGAHCLPPGVPMINGAPYPFKVVQTKDFLLVAYEVFNLWRQIFLDGRELTADANPTWLGYSTGKWEGDTLRVDTRGFNGKSWLDALGRPTTESLHVMERFHREDFGHLRLEVTIDDPGAYTRPWVVNEEFVLDPETELMEFICNENNRDLTHLSGN